MAFLWEYPETFPISNKLWRRKASFIIVNFFLKSIPSSSYFLSDTDHTAGEATNQLKDSLDVPFDDSYKALVDTINETNSQEGVIQYNVPNNMAKQRTVNLTDDTGAE